MLTVEQIVLATGCPYSNVSVNWPLVRSALDRAGILSDMAEVAAAATIAVETGTFAPVTEKMAKQGRQPDIWRMQERYKPWIGRGFVQITWEKNYRKYGSLIGVDLIEAPERAAEPANAAAILAAYFKESKVHDAANAKDWRRVRKLVNGGYNGWEHFIRVVERLLGRVQ